MADDLPPGCAFALGCWFQDLGIVCCLLGLPILLVTALDGAPVHGIALGAIGPVAIAVGRLQCHDARRRLEDVAQVPARCRGRV